MLYFFITLWSHFFKFILMVKDRGPFIRKKEEKKEQEKVSKTHPPLSTALGDAGLTPHGVKFVI